MGGEGYLFIYSFIYYIAKVAMITPYHEGPSLLPLSCGFFPLCLLLGGHKMAAPLPYLHSRLEKKPGVLGNEAFANQVCSFYRAFLGSLFCDS